MFYGKATDAAAEGAETVKRAIEGRDARRPLLPARPQDRSRLRRERLFENQPYTAVAIGWFFGRSTDRFSLKLAS
jgi:hypothetical protein